MKTLDKRVAIVTGGSRGIGEAIAKALVDAGASVMIASRKADGLAAVEQTLRAAGGDVASCPAHTGKLEDIERLVATTVERFGKVDILVNNAGTNPYFGPLLDTEWGAWDKTFEVNVKGYFAMTKAVVRHLESRNAPGAIINVASIMGTIAAPFQGVYGMTKAAVLSMTKTLAAELGNKGIRVNAISPGLIETKFAAALIESDMIRKPIVDRTPLGRIGQPEEIAGMVVFLASDAARFITGQNLVIDGGMTIT
ncbi:MAG: glucose 1-dehydrogenase [Myxococcota bacterium]